MPNYEYACRSCAEHLEVVQSFKDEPLTVCGACGGPLRKVFSPIGIAFKGSGFYRNDSRSATGKGKEAATKDEGAKSQADSAASSGSGGSGSGGSGSDGAASGGSSDGAAGASSAGEGSNTKSGDSKSRDSKSRDSKSRDSNSRGSRSGDSGSGAKGRPTGSPASHKSNSGSKASSAAS